MQFYFFLNQALDYGNKLSYYETMGLTTHKHTDWDKSALI